MDIQTICSICCINSKSKIGQQKPMERKQRHFDKIGFDDIDSFRYLDKKTKSRFCIFFNGNQNRIWYPVCLQPRGFRIRILKSKSGFGKIGAYISGVLSLNKTCLICSIQNSTRPGQPSTRPTQNLLKLASRWALVSLHDMEYLSWHMKLILAVH